MAAADQVYLRDAPAKLLPAPVASTGVLGWLRANLFSSPANITLTIVCVAAIVWIVPPLTSQYLNLTKNSSLAVAIGYPDLVQVFAGSVLNITGQAVEVIAITMAVYLFLSLVTSLLMNLYGRTVGIVER